ncbi:ras association domain-containing protein 10-like isoform X2 [Ruditapes philippinarum]|nr:ras association domain-containing protein 10-like isoform X2 [Ruditapes philippinarum]XP_060602606.1 ras association domain-containing protein 10-like isoform X2 [Ruditapes philippinarum]XP_060602607.1 ras association domain-containing protein 10-like isoform X2 [Ruditapes philippinarum]XP_060602608.1 ras association domain-containing protein 10-like isoform X2 [Ruditapes philippinarum]XP_060602609.1 ras association domain-containing protein 10-like isoform X2 [Ruditapes philippinarum]XP_06
MASENPVAEIEIPIWVKGTQKWVTGLTKRTTCDDVIYALMYQEGLHEHVNTSAYAIFEKWREVERPLQGRTKIVKVWRTWGAEQSNVHLSMRRMDELEYSGEFSLTRRKKRSRHKLRERERDRDRERERERRPREHRHHHHYCQNASDRLRSMETLVKLVISQERKLKDMIEHEDDTDKLIDRYESRLHSKRLKQNGDEYVKDVYLDGQYEDTMDEFFSNANIDELETYVSYCDKILEMEDQIKNEHSKIEDLAYQIQTCANENNTSEPAAENNQEDITKVQVDLNRAVSCAIMQQYKFQDLQRELQFYDEKLTDREEIYKRLQSELSELEDSHLKSNESLDSAASVNSSDSAGSNGILSNNPLPLPERTNRVQNQSNNSLPPPIPERTRPKSELENRNYPPHLNNQQSKETNQTREHVPERKPILKTSTSDNRNGFNLPYKQTHSGETKVRFKTDCLVDKYSWEESSLSEGISIDQSDCSDSKDLFDYVSRTSDYSHFKTGVADKPYLTVKVEDNDSNSDTGLSSMHSDDSAVYHLETLV